MGLLLFTKLNGQTKKRTLTRQEAYSYSNLVGNFLDYNDTGAMAIAKSELVIMLLEMDTIGRLTKIHLLAESQEPKSLYGVLKKMTPAYFNDKRVIYAAREKTIIFPVYSMKYREDKDNYLDKMRPPSCPFLTEDMSATVQEGMDFIQVNGITHVVGSPPQPKKPTQEEITAMYDFIEKENTLKNASAESNDKRKVYATVLNYMYGPSPSYVVITDSTYNASLIEMDYSLIANAYSKDRENIYVDKTKMDSTWVPLLLEADNKKHKLMRIKLHAIKPYKMAARLVSNDSICLAYKKMGHDGFEEVFKARDHLTLSNVILSGNKAIVEVSRMCGSLCGEGAIYVLERKNGRWMVVTRIERWVS